MAQHLCLLLVVVVVLEAQQVSTLLVTELHTLEQHTAEVAEAASLLEAQAELVVVDLIQHNLQMEALAVQAEQTQVVAVAVQASLQQTQRLHQAVAQAVQE
jgi:hypothetical protein